MSILRIITIALVSTLIVACASKSTNESADHTMQPVSRAGQGSFQTKPDGGTAYVFKFTDTGKDYECTSDVELDANNHPIDKEAWLTLCREVKAPEEKIVLSADMLFNFAKYRIEDISYVGRDRLNELASDLVKHHDGIQRVMIVGHADRIGNPQSNYTLSQNRAQTVASYLTQNGVDSRLLRVSGQGSDVPVSDCASTLRRNQLIECLAPDRRVEVRIIRNQQQ